MENLPDSLTFVHQDVTFSPELTNLLGISLVAFIIVLALVFAAIGISILRDTF